MKKHTAAPWDFACDSYGKVQHSKMACVYTNLKGPNGDKLVCVASRIRNWKDARLIAAAPELLEACKAFVEWYAVDSTEAKRDTAFEMAKAAVAKAFDVEVLRP